MWENGQKWHYFQLLLSKYEFDIYYYIIKVGHPELQFKLLQRVLEHSEQEKIKQNDAQKTKRFKADKDIQLLNEAITLCEDCEFGIPELLLKKRVELFKYCVDNLN